MKRAGYIERRAPLRARKPEQGGPETRRSALRAKRWGVKPAPKAANWRDDYVLVAINYEYMAEGAKKRTPYEKALASFVRRMPCVVCGRMPTVEVPNEASHVALSANQKGMGMRVPHVQVVSKCHACHGEWEERRGFCAGWSKDKRYAKAAEWLADLDVAITPTTRDEGAELERWGLGKVIGDGTPTGFAWLPGGLTEVPVSVLERAVPA